MANHKSPKAITDCDVKSPYNVENQARDGKANEIAAIIDDTTNDIAGHGQKAEAMDRAHGIVQPLRLLSSKAPHSSNI